MFIHRKPKVVGISSLGLDHVSLLGDTVEKIALHKAGIMKPDVPAFTVADQPGDSLKILASKAAEIQCTLTAVPALDSCQSIGYPVKLGLPGKIQLKNASLALQLTRAFLNPSKTGTLDTKQITEAEAAGLSRAYWPGRSQIINMKSSSYFIDGAHTPESIEACVQWFLHSARPEAVKRVLVFNSTGDRDAIQLLIPLHSCNMDLVIFCPNIIEATDSTPKGTSVKSVILRYYIRCYILTLYMMEMKLQFDCLLLRLA